MSKVLSYLFTILATAIVMIVIGIYTIKVENIENGMVTLEIFGAKMNYYWESEEI